LGIIDTISAALNTVVRKAWLAVVPVAVDLLLWLGPKVSIEQVLAQTAEMMNATLQNVPANGAEAEVAAMFQGTMQMVQESAGRANYLSLLSWGTLGFPSIAGVRLIDPASDVVVQLTSIGQALLFQVVVMGVGLMLACFFLGMLGQEARAGHVDVGQLLRRAPTYWLRMVIVFVPLGTSMFFAFYMGMLLGPLVIIILVAFIWLFIFMAFFPQAITMAEESAVNGIVASLRLVQSSMGRTLGFLLVIVVLNRGLGYVWARLMSGAEVLTLVAILANAYVGTALTLAMFYFYRDRMAALLEARRQQRSA
jgi:hypothetical protein